ncbi:unnamed protein product, partial [Discosporangium mesarthrocarpum]
HNLFSLLAAAERGHTYVGTTHGIEVEGGLSFVRRPGKGYASALAYPTHIPGHVAPSTVEGGEEVKVDELYHLGDEPSDSEEDGDSEGDDDQISVDSPVEGGPVDTELPNPMSSPADSDSTQSHVCRVSIYPACGACL